MLEHADKNEDVTVNNIQYEKYWYYKKGFVKSLILALSFSLKLK